MERTGAVITAYKLSWFLTDAAQDQFLVRAAKFLLLNRIICISVVSNDSGTRCIEQLLLEHVKTLHVHFLEDEHRVVPGVDIHHVFVGHRYRDRPARSAYELGYVQ